MTSATVVKLPERSEVNEADTWDLSKLFANDSGWDTAFNEFEEMISGYAQFRGTLANSPADLAKCLDFDSKVDRLAERMGNYAYLKTVENQTDSVYQRMMGRFQNIATRAGEESSYIRPEILAIPDDKLAEFVKDPALELHALALERLTREVAAVSGGDEVAAAKQVGDVLESRIAA